MAVPEGAGARVGVCSVLRDVMGVLQEAVVLGGGGGAVVVVVDVVGGGGGSPRILAMMPPTCAPMPLLRMEE